MILPSKILPGPSHLLVLHVSGSGFQEYLSHHLLRDQGEADQPVVVLVLLLALLEGRGDIFCLLVLRNLS